MRFYGNRLSCVLKMIMHNIGIDIDSKKYNIF